MIRIIHSVLGKESAFDHAGKEAVIGRPKPGATCDLDLTPDLKISRPHARVSFDAGRYWIQDLNSKHGTKINGQEIRGLGRREWRAGDTVTMGDTTLRIEPAKAVPPTAEDTGANADAPFSPEAQSFEPVVNIGPKLDATVHSTFRTEPGASDSERRIALLYELPLRFAKESRLDSLMQTIVEMLVEVIPGAARGAFLMLDRDSGGLVLKAHLPVGQPAVSTTLAQQAVTRREGFIWEQGGGDSANSIIMHRIGTGMYAPLLWREEVVGVICVDNPDRENIFSKEDLRLLMGVAHYAAMSVTHQRALDDLTRHADLTNRLLSNRFAPHLRQSLARAAATGALPIGTRQSHITMLISDIRGFTQLTARLGAQRMGDLLNEYFPPLIDAILAHNGAIERFVGDAIYAVFGSPEPDNQQHENAVRAALALQATTAAIMKSRLARKAETCEIGIGIDCGEALHGFIGNAERLEYTVIGEPANLASRYCNAAGRGEVLLSPQIHAHVFNKFTTERVEISTKHEGKMVAYRVKQSIE